MALKVANTGGGIAGSNVAAAINYATANGAKVINLSIATAPYTARSNIAAIEAAITNATNNGVVVVAGAGNNNLDLTNIDVWPASLSKYNPGVIAAGATTNSDTRASFSNYGSAVSLYAPGWWIMSTVLGGQWAYRSGTSMASPYVAGAVALVLASGQAVTPAAVRTRLVSTSDNTAAGARLNAAAAVGAQRSAVVAPSVAVTYSGTAALVADSNGTVTATVTANAASGFTQMRLSVATHEGGTVGAVEGLSATFADAFGQLGFASTGDQGDFPVVALRDANGLHGAGAAVQTSLNLPAGEYAFVTEMLDAGGAHVGGAQVAFVSVTASGGTGDGPATTTASNPIDTTPASSTPDAGGTNTTAPSVAAPATTQPAGARTPATTAPGAPAATVPAGTATTVKSGSSTVTTTPEATVTTVKSGGTTVTTTPAATATTVTAATATTVPAVTTPASATTQAPVTTQPPTVVATPTTHAPGVTTPTPPAATDGEYSVTGMSPRSASICGGGSVTLPGVYPASGAVYVWFGDAGPVVLAGGSTQALSVTVPAMVTPGVINVSARFQRDRTYTMTLASAFTYTAANCNAASTTAPTTTVAAGAGAGAGAVQATTTTAPAVTVPATTPTTEAKSGTTTPAVTTPAVTTPATPTTTPGGETTPTPTAPANSSAVVNTRGSLRIRMVAAGGVLSGLNGLWPGTGCKQTACPAIGF